MLCTENTHAMASALRDLLIDNDAIDGVIPDGENLVILLRDGRDARLLPKLFCGHRVEARTN